MIAENLFYNDLNLAKGGINVYKDQGDILKSGNLEFEESGRWEILTREAASGGCSPPWAS
jgi:hypothetical protein